MQDSKLPTLLIEMLEKQYGQEDTKQIIKGYERKRKVTFRVNILKAKIEEIEETLKEEKIEYNKVSWNKEVFILKDAKEEQIQNLKIYKEGKIYMQNISAMIPAIMLNPKPEECILDMTAAPGGKTTQIAAITRNNALITACEKDFVRAERLKYNIEKQGAKGICVLVKDAKYLDEMFSFDRILLDAPCSGSGTICLDNKNLQKKLTQKWIEKINNTQISLLKKAIKLLKPGCEMVYSTCSILSCENEEIINQIIKSEKVEIVPIQKIEEIPTLKTKIQGTLCVCPTELYEGFFVAKIKKVK